MSRSTGKRRKLMGVPRTQGPRHPAPGSITPPPDAPPSQLRIIAYSPDASIDVPSASPDQIKEYLHHYPVVWVNVDGIGDANIIKAIGEIFDIHRLALEDVAHVRQRPKLDDYPQHLYIVARMLDRVEGRLDTDQLSLFLGKDYIVTFQERAGDCFDAIRQRLNSGQGLLRRSGPDLLAYAILDAVVDDYYPVLEADGDSLEELEDELLAQPSPGRAASVHAVKRDLLVVRRSVWPLREVLGGLHRGVSPLISAETRIYMRDCYDHTVQLIDLLEVYRELATSLMELYMSSMSNRMNEIMKVLTIISTIFMPLTFIVGVYGMNFRTDASQWSMPELNWKYGYVGVMALMFLIALTMIIYFWRKGWLRSTRPPRNTDERSA
jgi:magnesium transporter